MNAVDDLDNAAVRDLLLRNWMTHDAMWFREAVSRHGIAAAIDTARRTRRIIRQNLTWAVGYNLVALPLAATGHVVPWMAALAMVASSLTVTLNALRLARVPA